MKNKSGFVFHCTRLSLYLQRQKDAKAQRNGGVDNRKHKHTIAANRPTNKEPAFLTLCDLTSPIFKHQTNVKRNKTVAQIDDEQLLAMLKSATDRDRGYRLLMDKYGSKLYWHIRRIVVAHEDAEDAMQETAINVFSSIDKFEQKSSLGTWLYRIATNEALRVLRRRTGFFQSIDSLGDTLVEKLEDEAGIDADATAVLFQKALLQLPTQQRLAFNLRYYDEMPYEEIAKITGKNVNTLKTNYHFAVSKIKNYLKENSL